MLHPLRLLPCLSLLTGLLSGADADLILHNGKILTVDAKFSIVQAVAIKGGRFVAVGDDRTVLAERGPKTKVFNLRGQTVVPGLMDSHVHPLEGGLSEFREPLPVLDSHEAIRNYIREQAKKTPKGQWIIVPRTFPTRLKELRMPTHEVLDVARAPSERVVKSTTFQAKPMTLDEAVLQLELLNSQFFVFQNAKDHAINVVYRRDDGNLGLIQARSA